MAKSLMERLRELLDGADDGDLAGEVEIEDDADEVADDATEEIEDDAEVDTDPEPDEVDPDNDGTPGASEEGDAADDDLRETIRSQAAMIETLRNRLAEAGLEDEVAAVEEADAEDDPEDADDEDVVEAFEKDYADRQARLADIIEGD